MRVRTTTWVRTTMWVHVVPLMLAGTMTSLTELVNAGSYAEATGQGSEMRVGSTADFYYQSVGPAVSWVLE